MNFKFRCNSFTLSLSCLKICSHTARKANTYCDKLVCLCFNVSVWSVILQSDDSCLKNVFRFKLIKRQVGRNGKEIRRKMNKTSEMSSRNVAPNTLKKQLHFHRLIFFSIAFNELLLLQRKLFKKSLPFVASKHILLPPPQTHRKHDFCQGHFCLVSFF